MKDRLVSHISFNNWGEVMDRKIENCVVNFSQLKDLKEVTLNLDETCQLSLLFHGVVITRLSLLSSYIDSIEFTLRNATRAIIIKDTIEEDHDFAKEVMNILKSQVGREKQLTTILEHLKEIEEDESIKNDLISIETFNGIQNEFKNLQFYNSFDSFMIFQFMEGNGEQSVLHHIEENIEGVIEPSQEVFNKLSNIFESFQDYESGRNKLFEKKNALDKVSMPIISDKAEGDINIAILRNLIESFGSSSCVNLLNMIQEKYDIVFDMHDEIIALAKQGDIEQFVNSCYYIQSKISQL